MDFIQVRGIPNLHSHAFQRAMAGMAEKRLHPTDSFWTWRETMYDMALRFSPDDLYAVARLLYMEMLEQGYTTVCEFHYVHHDVDGSPYAPSTAMSDALIEAARSTGIALTLLPVLYMTSHLDGSPLLDKQRRFGHTVASYLQDWETLSGQQDAGMRLGCALHSLRAVPLDAINAVVEELPYAAPIHIHIAEQLAEVNECVRLRGARPVQWLLDNVQVNDRWSLVHATHMDAKEIAGVAASGACVVICPTTEANLGDGIFPAKDYLLADGRWGIGSDSHISVSPVEELRWLEYAQRLSTNQRTVLATESQPSVASTLLDAVCESGPNSTGFSATELETHVVTLDADAPALIGARDDVDDRWIFSGNRNLVKDVSINGAVVVSNGAHVLRDDILRDYRKTMGRLLA